MKQYIALAIGIFAMVSCSDATSKIKSSEERMAIEAATTSELPIFQFENESHDFGAMNEGDVGTTEFNFTNEGEVPLIISSAQGSCGCTVPEYSNAPIAPGEQGTITVRFNSQGKPGSQTKTVTLSANTVPNTKVLTITAQVEPKAN
ncbi:MAG: DUF1573 domain-containing protein [Schleiferiaceae bacterium]|nr:DUF1573 domain-containing protein [Schleiferiaceae bacterium]